MQNIDTELIFKGSYGIFKVSKVWIYKDRIVYKMPLSGEQSIQINQITSIELGSSFVHPGFVVLETTGGQKCDILIEPDDQQKQFRDIIYQTQRLSKEKNNATSEIISRDKKKCSFCAEIILAEAKKCRYCGEFLDKVEAETKNTIENNNNHQSSDIPQTISEQKSKDANLIFETTYNGNETKVYKDKTIYKPPFMDEQPMPISRIASIELGKPSINEITVKLTNGQKCRIMVESRDQEKYKNAVYAQLAEQHKEKAELKKVETERQKIENKYIHKYIFLGLAIAFLAFIVIIFKNAIGTFSLWLFFASMACLIVGLIKPLIFSRFLKDTNRKRIFKIFGLSVAIFLFVFWIAKANEIALLLLIWTVCLLIGFKKPSIFSRFIEKDVRRNKIIKTFTVIAIISIFFTVVYSAGLSSNSAIEETTTQNSQNNKQQTQTSKADQNKTSVIKQNESKETTLKQTEPIKKETKKSIGVSRSQIMDKLVNDYNFTFQKDKPINGEENYIGENKYGLGTVRLTGEATNLSEVTIISSLSTVYSGNMASLILINALANMVDGNSDKWVGDELIKIGDLKSFSDEKVFGKNVFKVNFTYSSDSIPPVISLRIVPVK